LHFLGDGYQLLASLQSGVNYKPWETGTFLIQKSVYAILGGQGMETAERALQITSWMSGLLFALVSAFVGARLFSDNSRRLLYLFGVTLGGYALLFFGYLESYPLFVLVVGCLFQVGLLMAQDRMSRWYLLPLLAAAAFCHIFAVALLPGALYLLLRGTPMGNRFAGSTMKVKISLVAAVVVAGGAVFLHYYVHSYFFRFTIVPLFSSRFTVEGYTLFSGKHLLDYLNHFFQQMPGIVVALAVLGPFFKRRLWRRPEVIFILLTLLPSMGLVFIFNPGLGFPRDWDLFSFAGVPLVCGFFFLLLDEEFRLSSGPKAAALAVALSFLLLVPRVASQVMPEKAIAVFDNYSNLDIIRTGSGRFILLNYLEKEGRLAEKAERERKNVRLLPHELWDKEGQLLYRDGKISQAEAKFRRAIEYAPCFSYSWANVGTCLTRREQWDSALVYFKIADALNPFNSDTYNSLGYVYLNLGNFRKAEKYCLDALRIRPTDFLARGNLVKLYRKQDRPDDLVQMLLGLIDLDSVPAQYYFESANQLLQFGESDAATRICRRALEAGVDSSLITRLEADYPAFEFTPAGP
jgi:tetratricopeptide (TPR) repeat protein